MKKQSRGNFYPEPDWKIYAAELESRCKQLEAELIQTRHEAELLIQYTPTAIYEIELQGLRLITVNDAMCQATGYSREELLAINPFDLLDEASKKTFQERIQKTFSGEPFDSSVEYKIKTKDGREIWTVLHTSIQYRDGKPYSAFVIAHDITERKRTEEALTTHQSLLETIFEAQQDIVLLYDTNMNLRRANHAFQETYGFDPIGLNVRDIIRRVSCRELDGQPIDLDRQPTPRALKGEKVARRRFQVRRADGSNQIVETSASPIWMGEDIIGSVTVWHDITELQQTRQNLQEANISLEKQADQLRNQAEELVQANQALQKSEERYRTLIETSPYAIFVHADNHFLFANKSALQLFGVETFEQLKTHTLLELITPEDRTTIQARIQTVIKGSITPRRETRILRIDGGEVPIEAMGRQIEYQGKPAIQVIAHDITERKQAEALQKEYTEALRLRGEELDKARIEAETEKLRLEAVMDALPVGMAFTNEKGHVLQMNTAFEQVWGGKPPEAQSVRDYGVYKAWWVETGEEVKPEEWAAAQAVQKAKTIVGQMLEILRFDGTRAFVFNSASPVRDSNGKIVGSAVAIQDITRLREAEQELKVANELLEQRVKERTAELEASNIELEYSMAELQRSSIELEKALQNEKTMRQQLIQAEKYAALARLLASVAHEINNPLQTVKNSLFLLTPAVPAGETQEILKIAIYETGRIGSLVKQLHETYQPSNQQFMEFNIVELVQKVLTLLEPQMKQHNVQWQAHLVQECILVQGIPDQIRQVCLNICLNAIDAVGPRGGQLSLDVSRTNQEKVCISFHNTGPDIPEEHQAHIFEPFFTTKEKGLGLGLAICREIVKSHDGEITVESEPGNGVTFKVFLPVKEGSDIAGQALGVP